MEQVRTLQEPLKVKIREAKEKCRRRQNNRREVWCGMKIITGFRPTGSRGVKGNLDRANLLNFQ